MLRRLLLGLLTSLLLATPTVANWSIVVVNLKTGEVAVAMATCDAGANPRRESVVVVPEHGVAATQGRPDPTANTRALIHNHLQLGTPPDEIVAALAAQDPFHAQRQYGIVDLGGRTLSYTGSQCRDGKGERNGAVGDLVYAIQGNFLTGAAVLDEMEDALKNSSGDLGQRLLAVMEAARDMGGDGRCSCSPSAPTSCGSPPPNFQKTAHVGTLIVARPGDPIQACTLSGCARGDIYCALNVPGLGNNDPDPIGLLRLGYDSWRQTMSGRPDALLSTAWVSSPTVAAGSTTPVTIVLDLHDIDGVPLTSGGATVTVDHDARSEALSNVQRIIDHDDGTYTIELLPGATAGRDIFRVQVDDGILPVTIWPLPELVHLSPEPVPFNNRQPLPGIGQGGSDYSAYLLPDGLTCYYLSDMGGTSNYARLLRATRPTTGDPFGNGSIVPMTNPSAYDVIDFCVSEDELELIACGHLAGGSPEHIFHARRLSTTHAFDELVILEDVRSDRNEGGPWLAANELELYFHSQRDGGFDLWRARRPRTDGRWLPAEKMPNLETNGDERFPMLMDGGTRLVFSVVTNLKGTLHWADRGADHEFHDPQPIHGGLHPPTSRILASSWDSWNGRLWMTESDTQTFHQEIQMGLPFANALRIDGPGLSAAIGGNLELTLDAGPDWAGAGYRLLGGGTGIHPGYEYGGALLPVQYDAITAAVLASGNNSTIRNFVGVLGSGGGSRANFVLQPGQVTSPALLDRDYVFAYFAVKGNTTFASNAVTIRIVP